MFFNMFFNAAPPRAITDQELRELHDYWNMTWRGQQCEKLSGRLTQIVRAVLNNTADDKTQAVVLALSLKIEQDIAKEKHINNQEAQARLDRLFGS